MRCSLRAAVSVVIAVATTQALAAAASPRIVFDQVAFDFGTIYQGDEVTHSFPFRNTGDGPLKLGAVVSSCGCTAASTSGQEIAPGHAGSITVTFRSGLLRDKVLKHIYLDSSDAAAPRVTLSLGGFIKREVAVLPFAVYVPAIQIGESVTREVQIRPAEATRFRILGVTSNHAAIGVSEAEPIDDQQGGYRLVVTVRAQSEPVRVNAVITLRTDLTHARELQIPVYARVVGQAPPPLAAPRS